MHLASAASTRCSGVHSSPRSCARLPSTAVRPARSNSTAYSERLRLGTGQNASPSAVRGRAYARGVLRRLRPLTEAECYARCYGRGNSDVRLLALEPRRSRHVTRLSGEQVRRLFEQRLDARGAEAA
jgi:hypothetical protein